MEYRDRNKDVRTPSSIGHGNAVLTPATQAFDQDRHHHRHREFGAPRAQQEVQPGSGTDPTPDPDPFRLPPTSESQASPPPAAAPTGTVRYRECQKNHAASMGGHVVDGCGEFMPAGQPGTPEGLKCAACDCHRNFHRREADSDSEQQRPIVANIIYRTQSSSIRRNTSVRPTQPPPPPPPSSHNHHHRTGPASSPIMMAFGGGAAAAESSGEDLGTFQCYPGEGANEQPPKKRVRTKFTQEQKDRMHGFAEKLGWRIQKQDEGEMNQFCDGIGVKRQVFKVWMHNKKQATKKKQP